MKSFTRLPVPVFCLMALSSCAGVAGKPAAPVATLPASVHWFRNSVEKNVLFAQTYAIASERILTQAQQLAPGSWAVILDVDETLLDNSDYQLGLAQRLERYSDTTWNQWVRQESARALPGAVKFIDRIRTAGGRVVIVTNREQIVCDATRRNLNQQQLAHDAVLCADRDSVTNNLLTDKNPRFAAVARGLQHVQLPPLQVIAYIGDNIKDFPARSQANAEPLSEFGVSLFLLPNPMYGSWESIPEQ